MVLYRILLAIGGGGGFGLKQVFLAASEINQNSYTIKKHLHDYETNKVWEKTTHNTYYTIICKIVF